MDSIRVMLRAFLCATRTGQSLARLVRLNERLYAYGKAVGWNVGGGDSARNIEIMLMDNLWCVFHSLSLSLRAQLVSVDSG